MDTMTNSVSSVQHKIPTEKGKPRNKNKHIKVVYISNPMKVKTTVSEFRALVQELTGQDAELPPDLSRYSGHRMDPDEDCVKKKKKKIGHSENDHRQRDTNNNVQVQKTGGVSTMDDFEPFDDAFTPQMIENISAFLPESVFYECAQVDHEVLMQCNFIHQ